MKSAKLASNLPVCVICTDVISDPRQLPCGHSYCGPPKTCLEAQKIGSRLKCSLCKKEHILQISDLKPMYGLREFIEEQKEVTKVIKGDRLCCFLHPNSPVTLWCKICLETMCANCVELEKHSDHNFVPFSINLRSILKQQVENFTEERWNRIKDFNQEIAALKKEAQKSLKLADELEKAKCAYESNWIEIQVFTQRNGKLPEADIIEWFFHGHFKRSGNQLLTGKTSRDACCSTETIAKSNALTQTVLISSKPVTRYTATQASFKAHDPTPQKLSQTATNLDLNNVRVMYNDHFMDSQNYSGDSHINPIVIEFPYDRNQNGTLKSNQIVNEKGKFHVTIERVFDQLKTSVEFTETASSTAFTFNVTKRDGNEFWIWKYEKANVTLLERLTTLQWYQLKTDKPNKTSVIRTTLKFN
ncbi:uncharacterized protein LOC134851819 [Symsagittifera roscoffensis]|uniref:uncharacterized protein LOC134851819 n=1 Tax=Symsagittifera roscoffensis TaxID=84072 RepID=UPI00307BA5A8